jgi:hypothetical protein
LGDKASDLIINRLQMMIWNFNNRLYPLKSLYKWSYQTTWTLLIIETALQVTEYAMINCQLMRIKSPLLLKIGKIRRKIKNWIINR